MLKSKLTKVGLTILALLVLCGSLVGCMNTGAADLGWSGVYYEDGKLYFASMQGNLIVMDAETGNKINMADINNDSSKGGSCSGGEATVSIYGTPVLIDGVIYFASYSGDVFAYSADGLSRKWRVPNLGQIVAAVVGNGENIIVIDDAGKVTAIEKSSGNVAAASYQAEASVWSSPLVVGDNIYFGDFKCNYYCLNMNTLEEVWKYDEAERGAFYSQAACVTTEDGRDLIVVGNFDRSVYAFDAATGELVWQKEAGKNWYWAAPVVRGDKIYLGCLDGNMYVMDFDGNLLSTLTINSDRDDKIVSDPVIVGDLIIVITQSGYLCKIDENDNVSLLKNYRETLGSSKATVDAPLTTDGTYIYIHTQAKEEMIICYDPTTNSSIWEKNVKDIEAAANQTPSQKPEEEEGQD